MSIESKEEGNVSKYKKPLIQKHKSKSKTPNKMKKKRKIMKKSYQKHKKSGTGFKRKQFRSKTPLTYSKTKK
jgi:hypothetical protein